jgi:hypothetical protein
LRARRNFRTGPRCRSRGMLPRPRPFSRIKADGMPRYPQAIASGLAGETQSRRTKRGNGKLILNGRSARSGQRDWSKARPPLRSRSSSSRMRASSAERRSIRWHSTAWPTRGGAISKALQNEGADPTGAGTA